MNEQRQLGSNLRHGGRILVDQLALNGCDRVFQVPGESFLAVLDGLFDHPEIEIVTCRQEGGAAMMAEADGKLTGRPGVAIVTRGPGACNASTGVHIAFQDSTPMILLVGDVGRDLRDREAFQEVDFTAFFAPLAKRVERIESTARIPEYISRAWHTAISGRPGPVVLALPEDMLRERVDVADAPPAAPAIARPGADDLDRFRELLTKAARPFLLLGGGGWDARACADIQAFAQAWSLPVGTAFRRQDRFDNTHPLFAGDVGIGINPALRATIDESDLLIALGPRLGEMTTGGYGLIDVPSPAQSLVHVFPAADEVGRVYHAELGIAARPDAFASAVAGMVPDGPVAWADRAAAAHQAYVDWSIPKQGPGDVQFGEVIGWLARNLPDNAIITNGAGNYNAWVHRYYRHRAFPTQIGSTNGTMGYGVPAAVAAKLRYPDRPVVAFAGDGCFLMHGQEIATAVQHDAPVIFIVVNNGMFATIRMHQEREYPGRISGTRLHNPDFAALADAFGLDSHVVTRTDVFGPAFDAALASGRPSLIELRVDPEALTPAQTLAGMRAAGQQAHGARS